MGLPNSEVGYTSAMPRREDHEVHKDMWGGIGGKKIKDVEFQFIVQTLAMARKYPYLWRRDFEENM